MSRSDTSLEQRPIDWDKEDQARWWADQRRDEEELQRMQMEAMRDQIKHEIMEKFIEEVRPEIEEFIRQWGIKSYRTGFVQGFAAALGGAGLYIYFVL